MFWLRNKKIIFLVRTLRGVKFQNKLLALMSQIFFGDAVNKKVLHKLSKLLLTNASGRVEFYTPDS